MKMFNMYVKTVITNDQGRILLLKEKSMDKQPKWDLPGVPLTEDESFDETIINNLQKENGYYVYPGKIIGVGNVIANNTKEVHVIMEGSILNGELLLGKHYDEYMWVNIGRLADYPLTLWLHEYLKENKIPFKDVEEEINKLNDKAYKRREMVEEDIIRNRRHDFPSTADVGGSMKTSFGLLKDTIVRTFHPKKANVTRTEPKAGASDYSSQYPQEDISVDKHITHEQIRRSKIKTTEDPEIRIIHQNEKPPKIRTEKEFMEKFSFSTGNLRSNWKEKLNEINKTDANKKKKRVPLPKGKKRN